MQFLSFALYIMKYLQKKLAGKKGNQKSYGRYREVIGKLFGSLRERFLERKGGYTRIIRTEDRIGDSAPTCYIEYLK